MSVCCECCVLSARCLCVGLITCTEEYYHVVWCVCDNGALILRRPQHTSGFYAVDRKSLFFGIIPEHIDEFVTYWYEEILFCVRYCTFASEAIHRQTFCSLIIVGCANM